jgi:hypothetical protein
MAQQLGVGAMSLYTYVADHDERLGRLLDGLASLVS